MKDPECEQRSKANATDLLTHLPLYMCICVCVCVMKRIKLVEYGWVEVGDVSRRKRRDAEPTLSPLMRRQKATKRATRSFCCTRIVRLSFNFSDVICRARARTHCGNKQCQQWRLTGNKMGWQVNEWMNEGGKANKQSETGHGAFGKR